MAKAIYKTADGFSAGVARLGRRGEGRGSPGQQVYDGDTVNVEADGNIGVRLLGVDAPEVSFTLPEQAARSVDRRAGAGFVSLSNERWQRFLTDPFRDGSLLRADLRRRLEPRLGRDCAANHARHATAGRVALRAEVERDLAELGGDRETFRFFMAFATEVIDGYGRLLCFLNRDQPRGRRPPTYNERLLDSGHVVPYFIWPNIDPFRRQPSLVDAVPSSRRRLAALDGVRERVQAARAAGLGVWKPDDPLRLLPFELRFLGRGAEPDRWVIDLAAADDRLFAPQLYARIERAEDRLFVPAAYVPLFESKRWRAVRS